MKRQQIRIIGGRWRSRRIQFLNGPGLRPTGDRNRETLFNWLAPYLPDAYCLDLFSGSGILSFESLSRGAAHVTALESSKKVATQIKMQAEQLGAESMHVIAQDCLAWLKAHPTVATPYDICFIDPPFHTGLLDICLERLAKSGLLANGALIYIEHEQALQPALPDGWEQIKSKQAGQVIYALYQLD